MVEQPNRCTCSSSTKTCQSKSLNEFGSLTIPLNIILWNQPAWKRHVFQETLTSLQVMPRQSTAQAQLTRDHRALSGVTAHQQQQNISNGWTPTPWVCNWVWQLVVLKACKTITPRYTILLPKWSSHATVIHIKSHYSTFRMVVHVVVTMFYNLTLWPSSKEGIMRFSPKSSLLPLVLRATFTLVKYFLWFLKSFFFFYTQKKLSLHGIVDLWSMEKTQFGAWGTFFYLQYLKWKQGRVLSSCDTFVHKMDWFSDMWSRCGQRNGRRSRSTWGGNMIIISIS